MKIPSFPEESRDGEQNLSPWPNKHLYLVNSCFLSCFQRFMYYTAILKGTLGLFGYSGFKGVSKKPPLKVLDRIFFDQLLLKV